MPDTRAIKRWNFRIIPVLIVGVFGVAAYAVVGRLCVENILRAQGKTGLAAGLLVLFFPLYILTLVSYARVFFAVQLDPGLVPLANGADRDEPGEKRRHSRLRHARDAEEPPWAPPDSSPDSPGLEAFYSKDVFACEADGRPKWCSECRQWKPDRAHHSRELGRCVRKMDHLCPWVGGMVSETSFNFFTQFTFYTACLCALCGAISVYCLVKNLDSGNIVVDGWVIAIIAISSIFGLFSFGMTLTAGHYILTNITNIDMLRRRQTFNLAVRIPRGTPPSPKYQTITYPLLPTAAGATMPVQADYASASASARDQDAFRTFAILKTEPYENPWHLGFWENWKSVMGNKPSEWFLPIRHSPCCNHDSVHSDYPLGPLLDELRKRYELPDDK
ncbi:DHHC zinc finger membrane protein [Metarhizium album ARSEF 1941]|uniref:Palmitoyltransferase n=1 Tax=Metarhizium album (strain ARSEF 1941) TaxID=1081103 RepID=A0A0B2X3R1_METAS|nr:DHHC zinc finger membrane protein [Metarhizium album ARSEF 1941]KHO00378.1 DHHC zinc finger membrane protein [Metarhizium album ARSEF 1941]